MEQIITVLECGTLASICAFLEKTEDTDTIVFLLKTVEDILELANEDDQLENLLKSRLMSLQQEEIPNFLKGIDALFQAHQNEEIQRISSLNNDNFSSLLMVCKMNIDFQLGSKYNQLYFQLLLHQDQTCKIIKVLN